ncbi:hypothetical protein Trydic_g6243, partial [Trypoxylus dichotomus]
MQPAGIFTIDIFKMRPTASYT